MSSILSICILQSCTDIVLRRILASSVTSSFYSFNSGDLSTAASRRVPSVHPAKPDDASPSTATSAGGNGAAPLYARFRQSTSPLMNNDTFTSTSPATSPPLASTSPALDNTKSFLQLDDAKDVNANASLKHAKAGEGAKGDQVDGVNGRRQHRGNIPSLTIQSGDDP